MGPVSPEPASAAGVEIQRLHRTSSAGMFNRSTYRDAATYRLRILVSTAATLLLIIGLVRLWPGPGADDNATIPYRIAEQERIEIEEIQPTQQSSQAPPPPAPPIPVVVPNDVLHDHDLDFSDTNMLSLENPGVDEMISEGLADGPAKSGGETFGPKAVRFVEPEYTREARRRRVRAEVVIEVLVDKGGRVLETRIEERFLLDKEGTERTPVAEIGYGLEAAAQAAAKRWIFRPARTDGVPVSSYTTLTFTFGV